MATIEDLIGNFVGRIAQGVRPDDPVARHYGRILRDVGMHALSKWSAVSAAGLTCTLVHVDNDGVRRGCAHPAAGPCRGCGNMVCLEHAMLSSRTGEVLCMACLQRIPRVAAVPPPPHRRRPQPPPGWRPPTPPPADEDAIREQHLKTLGLPPTAGLDEVRLRFKQISKTEHPDKHRHLSQDDYDRAEAAYKKKAEAFNWLRQHMQEAA